MEGWHSDPRRCCIFLGIVAALLIAALPLSAQEKFLPVFHLQKVSGIISQIASRVVRDEEGFVWIGMTNGLERYDGYTVKDYRNILDNPNSLSSNWINALLMDSKQRLWVGTNLTGLSLYDRVGDRFLNLLPRKGDTSWYQGYTITSLTEDHSGNLWLGSRYAGVMRAGVPADKGSQNPDSLCRHIRFTTYSLGTPRNSATDLVERGDGKILVASDKGLIVLDPTTDLISRPNFATQPGSLLDSTSVHCFCRDSDNILWVGTDTAGLFRIDWKDRTVQNYRHMRGDVTSIESDNILDIAMERNGNLWLATDGGLQLFSPRTGQCIRFLTVGPDPLRPTTNMKLSVDRFGTLWVGEVQSGVYWLSVKSQLLPHFALPALNGSSPRQIHTMQRDLKGRLWFSSDDRIFQVDTAVEKVVRTIDVFQGKKSTSGNRWSFIDKRGCYWYGAWGLGLFQVDLSTGRIRNFVDKSKLGASRTAGGIAQGSGDTLLIYAELDGLKKFDPVTGKFIEVRGPPKGPVGSVIRDHRGMIWVASATSGVTILDPVTGTMETLTHNPSDPRSLSSNQVRRVYEDPKGRIWIGANTLNLWDPTTRAIIRYPNPGFSKAYFVKPLCSDAKGRLWVGFLNGGLSMFDPATGTYENFDGSDGVCGEVSCMVTLEDGRAAIGGLDGLNIFYPDSVGRQRHPPPLVLTRMGINDEPVSPPLVDKQSSPVNLPYSKNVLEFEFAAIDIDAQDLVQYQYQLNGLESDWVKPKTGRYVRYAGLSPGDYVFRVRATSSRDEWPGQEIALAISISPPWWGTWWFRTVVFLLFGGLIALVYHREVSRLQREKKLQQEFSQKQIESQEAERKHLASELHDGLGQDLLIVNNELQQFLNNGDGSHNDLQRMSMLMQESIESVREISSNLHPHHIERLGFCAAVDAMVEKISHSSTVAIQCTCDQIDAILPKGSEIHFYRIIQESLSNIVKHSSATSARLDIRKKTNTLEVMIADNGRGFKLAEFVGPESTRGSPTEIARGFGLASMSERARIIGGKLKIESTPQRGTTVLLTIPVPERS